MQNQRLVLECAAARHKNAVILACSHTCFLRFLNRPMGFIKTKRYTDKGLHNR